MDGKSWRRIVGDGQVYSGPCLVCGFIGWFDGGTAYIDIYDGRDATSGKKFARWRGYYNRTLHMNLGSGVRFDLGVYIDAEEATQETTVILIPCE